VALILTDLMSSLMTRTTLTLSHLMKLNLLFDAAVTSIAFTFFLSPKRTSTYGWNEYVRCLHGPSCHVMSCHAQFNASLINKPLAFGF
jgi:hypothetical protein